MHGWRCDLLPWWGKTCCNVSSSVLNKNWNRNPSVWTMLPLNRSPICTGRHQYRKIGDIQEATNLWELAQDVVVCRIRIWTPIQSMQINCLWTSPRNSMKFWVRRSSISMFQKLLAIQQVIACFQHCPGAPTTKSADRQYAAGVLIPEQVCEVVPNQHITSFQTLSNDNYQLLIWRLLCLCTYQYHHSHCKSEVWWCAIESIDVLTCLRNSSKSSLSVTVQVETNLFLQLPSRLSIHLNLPFVHNSMEVSQLIWIVPVVSRSLTSLSVNSCNEPVIAVW